MSGALDRWIDRTIAEARADERRKASRPPVYLALDLWLAMGLEAGEFDAYYDRNGWADTWSNLLQGVRTRSGLQRCGVLVDGEPCVTIVDHIGPHIGASDVGSSEPLPDQQNRSQ